MAVHEEGISGTAWFVCVRDPDGIPVELPELPVQRTGRKSPRLHINIVSFHFAEQ